MRVLVAMSGGVDSSVAAALVSAAGHHAAGATLKLWGGPSDSGCCSVSDVDDARRVADQLGIDHHVFNLVDEFDRSVVTPYVADHAAGRTPNPCIECNRAIKFGSLLERARRLGYDALATGHHARLFVSSEGVRLLRGADLAKDQSYVLSVLGAPQLRDVLLPVGDLTKAQVRAHAARLGLRTAAKPDSQDVCFIHSGAGRGGFLSERMALHPGSLVDGASGAVVGTVPAMELVTVGQRRGLGLALDGRRRYALRVDVHSRQIAVGTAADATARRVAVAPASWLGSAPAAGARLRAQTTAHGRACAAVWEDGTVVFDEPQPLVAPGQTVAFYDEGEPDRVLGAATAAFPTATPTAAPAGPTASV
jgi:tRNA-specific 2-thiouridylase